MKQPAEVEEGLRSLLTLSRCREQLLLAPLVLLPTSLWLGFAGLAQAAGLAPRPWWPVCSSPAGGEAQEGQGMLRAPSSSARGRREQGMQHGARAELRTGSGCRRVGKEGPGPSRESPWQGAGKLKRHGRALPGMLNRCECCRGICDLEQ